MSNANPKTPLIDKYSIFDLMPASLAGKEKDNYLLALNDEIWNRFFEQRLPFLLTTEQLDELREKLDAEADLADIMDWLGTLVPNTTALLAEYAREVKAEEIVKNLSLQLAEADKILAKKISPENTKAQQERQQKLLAAVGYAEQNQWDDVYRVLHDGVERSPGSEGYHEAYTLDKNKDEVEDE